MKLIAVAFFFAFICSIYGQTEQDTSINIDLLSSNKSVKVIGLPLVFYTPETSFGAGGGAQFYFPKLKNTVSGRESKVMVSLVYTLESQLLIEVKPQIYLLKGSYLLDAKIKYQIFPNSFWGVGNSTESTDKERYVMNSFISNVGIMKHLKPNLNFGFEYILEDHVMVETKPLGLLASDSILGSNGTRISGIGVIFNSDSRNVLASPTDGEFLQIKAMTASKLMGSDQSYNKFVLDLRTYQKIGRKSVLAFQGYSENLYGKIPFQAMAWYGGGERGRGYFKGRYMDVNQYVIQAEYRYRFHSRWIWSVFALAGDVTNFSTGYDFSTIKPSAGSGVRFQFVKSQDLLLRIDYGVGIDGSSGIYFGVNEAF